jgi:chromosomal replication initiation ATPase DnaA
MTQQLRLGLSRPGGSSFEEFVRGPSNSVAAAAVEGLRGGALALVGPEGGGKSHLASAWAARVYAIVLSRAAPDVALANGRPVLLEDVDRGVPAEALFHLINLAARPGGALLLTARTPPISWPATLPDLRSRLNALPVAEVEPPDDVVLEGLLRRFFREKHMTPGDEIYAYLLRRMDRSAPRAREIVHQLDEAGDAVTRALARQVLEADDENLDLFE